MKKFNHLFVASVIMLTMIPPLCAIQSTQFASYVALPFVGGVIHGMLTHNKDQKTRLQTMAVTGVATATVLAANDYLNLRASRKTWDSKIDSLRNSASQGTNISRTFINSDGTEITIKAQSGAITIKFSPPEAEENYLKFNKQDAVALFLLRSVMYGIGDYVGRKLMETVNKKRAATAKTHTQANKIIGQLAAHSP